MKQQIGTLVLIWFMPEILFFVGLYYFIYYCGLFLWTYKLPILFGSLGLAAVIGVCILCYHLWYCRKHKINIFTGIPIGQKLEHKRSASAMNIHLWPIKNSAPLTYRQEWWRGFFRFNFILVIIVLILCWYGHEESRILKDIQTSSKQRTK